MSDEDSQLALSCVEHGWRYSRLTPGASASRVSWAMLNLASHTASWSIEYTDHHELVDLVCDLIDA